MPSRRPVMKRLREIEYTQIDRVGSGAQPDAHITLVKARKGERVTLTKLVDPASIDAKVQAVREEFRSQYSDAYGCCSPCSGYVYVDAVYDAFVIACDSDGDYWRFSYTLGAQNEVEFGAPEAITPEVTWSASADDDATPPTPVMKAKAMWEAPAAERISRKKKEPKMPPTKTPVKKSGTAVAEAPDLTALDDETRQAVEAALAENATLTADKAAFDEAVAAAETVPEPEVDDDEVPDLGSVEGLRKAISKSRGENKKVLSAVLTRLEKSEDTTAKLQKAARIRLFKERAAVLPHAAAHAVDAGGDPVAGLAGLMEAIDDGCGSETAEAVEALLTKANDQIWTLLDKKDLLKSVGKHEGRPGASGGAIVNADDPVEAVDSLAADLMKENPNLSLAQARVRVLKNRPELYAQAEAQ